MTVLKLLGPAWTRAFRCIWMLEELGIPYENIAAMPMSRGVRQFHKPGKVPVLLEYESPQSDQPSFTLYESVAINTYLADTYGSNAGLTPPFGTRDRAKYNQLVCCILSELDAQGLWIHRKHDAMGRQFGNIPEAVLAAEQQFLRINKDIAGNLNPYLLGEQFTAADILYVHCLDWAKSIGWHESWPSNINPYRKLCHERPAYQRAKALRDENKDERKKEKDSKDPRPPSSKL